MVECAAWICLAGRALGGSHGAGLAWAGWTQTAVGTGALAWKPWPWASVVCSLGFGGEYPQCWGWAPSTRFDPLTLNASQAQVSLLGPCCMPWCLSLPSWHFSAFAAGPPARFPRLSPMCLLLWVPQAPCGSTAGVAKAVGRRWGVSPSGALSVGDHLPSGWMRRWRPWAGSGRGSVRRGGLPGCWGASWAFPVSGGPRSPSARAVGELVPAELRLLRSPPCSHTISLGFIT